MFTDIEIKIKKRNKLLFTRQSFCLQELRNLICRQKHLTIVLWAFDCLQLPMNELLKKYPNEVDIKKAYDLCLLWAHGEIKMPIAKRGILDCHAVAKRLADDHDIALCHAIGQGCSAVHVETHAIGLVAYELTAIVIGCGYTDYQEDILAKIDFYYQKLKWWQENISIYETGEKWADFLTKSNAENKERALTAKMFGAQTFSSIR